MKSRLQNIGYRAVVLAVMLGAMVSQGGEPAKGITLNPQQSRLYAIQIELARFEVMHSNYTTEYRKLSKMMEAKQSAGMSATLEKNRMKALSQQIANATRMEPRFKVEKLQLEQAGVRLPVPLSKSNVKPVKR